MRIIAGSLRSRTLEAPPGLATRPTSDRLRETLFNVLAPRIEGASFLDLYAGSGAVGLEALSRGAAQVAFVERAPAARTACSISRCEVMPTFLRNLRRLTLNASSFMIASRKCRKDVRAPSLYRIAAAGTMGAPRPAPVDKAGQIGEVLPPSRPLDLSVWPARIEPV